MSRRELIEQARSFFLAGAADTCTIRRNGSGQGTDEDGNVPDSSTVLYTGPCRVQQNQPYAERNNAGEAYLLLLRVVVQLPMEGTAGLRPDDRITMDTSETDPDLPGRVFVIRDLAHKTDASSRRVQAQEVTS